MSTTQHYAGTVPGFYSGSVRGNWTAVQNDAHAAAVRQIFNEICAKPDTAWCTIEGLSRTISTHGFTRRYTGEHTLVKVAGSEHEHVDRDDFGRFKHWQGNAMYNYDFQIEEHSV
jgi:hypothetical protein